MYNSLDLDQPLLLLMHHFVTVVEESRRASYTGSGKRSAAIGVISLILIYTHKQAFTSITATITIFTKGTSDIRVQK